MKQDLSPFTVAIGNAGHIEEIKFESRTPEQFLRVKEIAARPDFAFSCGPRGMFCKDIGTYKGTTSLTWYDKKERLHTTRISPRGKITKEICDGEIQLNKELRKRIK